MILTFTGASGTGKTSTMKRILTMNSGAKPLTSTTTRGPRSSDAPGEYEYVSNDVFRSLVKNGKFAWKTENFDRQYGTRRMMIDLMLESHDHLALATLDQSGVAKLHAIAVERGCVRNAVSIYFLSPGADILRQRLLQRRDTEEQIEKRISMCENWDALARNSGLPFHFLPDNGDLEEKLNFSLRTLADS